MCYYIFVGAGNSYNASSSGEVTLCGTHKVQLGSIAKLCVSKSSFHWDPYGSHAIRCVSRCASKSNFCVIIMLLFVVKRWRNVWSRLRKCQSKNVALHPRPLFFSLTTSWGGRRLPIISLFARGTQTGSFSLVG